MKDLLKTDKCTGCGACVNICNTNAIKLETDQDGYKYPVINEVACADCGLCTRFCHVISDVTLNSIKEVFALQSADESVLLESASGGASAEMADAFIKSKGIVYGAYMKIKGSVAEIRHVRIDKKEDIYKIQGSKYAMSDTMGSYSQIKEDLEKDKIVLFFGLPCQVAGLRSYLLRGYENLYSVDLLCHGNTTQILFNLYLGFLQKNYGKEINEYIFRDKKRGREYTPTMVFGDGSIKRLSTFQYAYWWLIQYSKINMPACYSCKYCKTVRVGDATIGDYWGIENVRPELMLQNNGLFDGKYGISVLMINNEKGKSLFDMLDSRVHIARSCIEEVGKDADPLYNPQPIPEDRERILEIIKRDGYDGVVSYCKRKMGFQYYKEIVKDWKIVKGIRDLIKK